MKIASWNINSIRIRTHLLEQVAQAHAPEIICLQETKVEDALFPHDAMAGLGYTHRYISGQKGYHGVAIVSKIPLENVHDIRVLGHESRRHIAATLPDGTELHNFYVPAGGDIPDRVQNPYFGFKLDFVEAMGEWFAANRSAKHPMLLVGDLNIAPLPEDVWSHKQMLGVVSHTPAETNRMNALYADLGWQDTARHFTPPPEKLFSWWSYRNRDWKKSDRGRRLDHIWATAPLMPRVQSFHTLRDARNWQRPSDHVPLIVELKD